MRHKAVWLKSEHSILRSKRFLLLVYSRPEPKCNSRPRQRPLRRQNNPFPQYVFLIAMRYLGFQLGSRLPLQILGRQMRSCWCTRRTVADSPSLRKRLGQHLLVNPTTLRFIAESAGIQPSDHVLEIGPGTGNLTVHLLERAGAVTAVELDERMCQHLK